jgi:hypothetical protein
MSKAKEQNHDEIPEDGIGRENQGDPENPEGQNDPGSQGNPGNQNDPGNPNNSGNQGNPGGQDSPGDQKNPVLAVEDHAKREAVPASVFAAVMQTQNWAAGKKVTAEDFKKAVDAFLKAPIGGRKPPEGEKQ